MVGMTNWLMTTEAKDIHLNGTPYEAERTLASEYQYCSGKTCCCRLLNVLKVTKILMWSSQKHNWVIVTIFLHQLSLSPSIWLLSRLATTYWLDYDVCISLMQDNLLTDRLITLSWCDVDGFWQSTQRPLYNACLSAISYFCSLAKSLNKCWYSV